MNVWLGLLLTLLGAGAGWLARDLVDVLDKTAAASTSPADWSDQLTADDINAATIGVPVPRLRSVE